METSVYVFYDPWGKPDKSNIFYLARANLAMITSPVLFLSLGWAWLTKPSKDLAVFMLFEREYLKNGTRRTLRGLFTEYMRK